MNGPEEEKKPRPNHYFDELLDDELYPFPRPQYEGDEEEV
jgi:hypothetical protein